MGKKAVHHRSVEDRRNDAAVHQAGISLQELIAKESRFDRTVPTGPERQFHALRIFSSANYARGMKSALEGFECFLGLPHKPERLMASVLSAGILDG
jgi:hypothetical protein